MRPRVLLSVPNTGWIHKLVTFSVVRLLQWPGAQTTFIAPTWVPYEHSMNRIAKDFIEGPYDFWLNIDADNPPFGNPLELTGLGLDIVGCPTPIYHFDSKAPSWPICWNGMDAVEDGWREHQAKDGLQEVDAVGSGCVLFSRRAIETVPPPWFRREVDEWGRVVCGPDFGFCQAAKSLGLAVHCHYGCPCRHFKELELCEAVEAFRVNSVAPTPSPSI